MITVDPMSVVDESDSQAEVSVDFTLSFTRDGERRTRAVTSTYQTRTYQGPWYAYAFADSTG